MAAVAGTTFDIALVSNSLIGGPANQELLQLHPGFLLVRGVHTQRGLHHCGRRAGIESGLLRDFTDKTQKACDLAHLYSSWNPDAPSPCPVFQHLETRACLPQWPRQTPRPKRHTSDQYHMYISV